VKTGPIDRLLSLLAREADDEAGQAIAGRPVAVGWSTVELERATLELAAALDLPAERFVDAAPTPILGARCRMAQEVLPSGVALVVLEPFTEGRLAGSLARHGEGPVAVWLAVAGLSAAVAVLRRAGVATAVERPGPLGAERLLLLDRPTHGPYRLIIELAGTIRA
jgi:hypothetical protein